MGRMKDFFIELQEQVFEAMYTENLKDFNEIWNYCQNNCDGVVHGADVKEAMDSIRRDY